MYYVLFTDDFGDKHFNKFEDYKDAREFYHTNKLSSVIFPYALISEDDLWLAGINYHNHKA